MRPPIASAPRISQLELMPAAAAVTDEEFAGPVVQTPLELQTVVVVAAPNALEIELIIDATAACP